MKRMRLSLALLAGMAGTACATQQTPTPQVPPTPPAPVAIPLAEPPRPVGELLDQLRAPDAPSRVAAAWALAGAGTLDHSDMERLVAALDDPSEPVREAAAWAIFHVQSPGFELTTLIDIPPKPLVMTRPTYPRDAFDKKIQGVVQLDVLINAIGRVVHAEVRQSLPGLNEAALACVRDWTFKPGMRRGRPVPVVAHVPIGFKIF